MSFLGRGPGGPSGGMSQEKLDMAMAELDMVTDIFNRIVTYANTVLPRKMHIPRYAEGDLNKGESVCIDRCVAKYFEVNKKVGEKLQTAGANAQATGTFGP